MTFISIMFILKVIVGLLILSIIGGVGMKLFLWGININNSFVSLTLGILFFLGTIISILGFGVLYISLVLQ